MSVVTYYTREQWEALGGWRYVEEGTDNVCLLFRDEDEPDQDVLPVTIRVDPATKQPWPEDQGIELLEVPYRYYKRVWGDQWILQGEGADKTPHSRIFMPRVKLALEPTAPITKEALWLLGFEIIHMNANLSGGYFKLIKDLPTPKETHVTVTFGCFYCWREKLDYIVWIGIGGFMESTAALVHIRTLAQLDNLWLALTGEPLITKKEPNEAQ